MNTHTTPLATELVAYTAMWRGCSEGYSAHLTTLHERDFRLWAAPDLVQGYVGRHQWVRLHGLALGSWFVATHIGPARPGSVSTRPFR